MSSIVQILRRVTGTPGGPTTAGREGQLAINLKGAVAGDTRPALYAYLSGNWVRVFEQHDSAAGITVSTQSIDLTPHNSTGNIGAAYTAWAAAGGALSGDVVTATFGSPAQAYILTNHAASGTDASWTSLGGSVPFATQQHVNAGTAAAEAISPKTLKRSTWIQKIIAAVSASHGNADAGKIILLGSSGKIDASMLPAVTAPPYATQAETDAGVVDNKAVAPKTLKASTWIQKVIESVSASHGSADANKLVHLAAAGKLDMSVIPDAVAHGQQFQGAFAPSSGAEYPITPSPSQGYFWIVEGLAAGYAFTAGDLAGKTASNRDSLHYDGTHWHLVGQAEIDTSGFLKLDGTRAMSGQLQMGNQAIVDALSLTMKSGATVPNINGAILDAGTF